MTNQQVMTLDNPAGLLLSLEILQQIGVRAGDQIEISVIEGALIVRSLTEAEIERKKAATLGNTEDTAAAATATLRELVNEVLIAAGVEEVTAFKVTLADGRTLLLQHADDPQLDEVVKRADVREISRLESAMAGGGKRAMDEIMRDLLERRRAVYEKLAEGAQ